MRTIMILHDTLRRDMLSCYNPDTDVKTPNMDALAADSLFSISILPVLCHVCRHGVI